MTDSIINGDCIEVMRTMKSGSVDFILTDPPYIARYKDRNNRSVINDDNGKWLEPAFSELHRLLKPDAFCISFYGWPKVDLFFSAWRRAGFRIVGHIVFRKRYASKSAFVQYRHEAAYLLVKGNPPFPTAPLPDVMDWVYTGNRLHPSQKSIHILKPLIRSFTQPGDVVLDPFAGSGSTLKAARQLTKGASASSLTLATARSPEIDLQQHGGQHDPPARPQTLSGLQGHESSCRLRIFRNRPQCLSRAGP